VSRRSFPPCDLQPRTIYRRLSRTSLACRKRPGLVPKVCIQQMTLFFEVLTILCGRCDAEPNDLDAPGSHRRTHEKMDYLIKNFDPGILWDEYGIRADIVVR